MTPSLNKVIEFIAKATSNSGSGDASSSAFTESNSGSASSKFISSSSSSSASSSSSYISTSSSRDIAMSSAMSSGGGSISSNSYYTSSSSSSSAAAHASSFSSSATATPLPSTYELLSHVDFLILCLFTLACFYAALYLSAAAVGESTTPLTRPFAFVLRLCRGMGRAIRATIRRRRLTFAGVPHEDSAEEEEDGEGGYLNINSPAPGAM